MRLLNKITGQKSKIFICFKLSVVYQKTKKLEMIIKISLSLFFLQEIYLFEDRVTNTHMHPPTHTELLLSQADATYMTNICLPGCTSKKLDQKQSSQSLSWHSNISHIGCPTISQSPLPKISSSNKHMKLLL